MPGPTKQEPLVEQAVDDVSGDRLLGGAVARRRAGLAALEQPRLDGHAEIAVEPRRDRPRAQGVLVDVHHLGLDRRADAALGDEQRQPAGGARVDGEDGRVHLHPGRDAEHRHPVAHGLEHVDGRSVAAREEQEVDPVVHHGRRGRPRVRRRRLGAERPDHTGDEPGRRRLLLAHRARVGDELHVG